VLREGAGSVFFASSDHLAPALGLLRWAFFSSLLMVATVFWLRLFYLVVGSAIVYTTFPCQLPSYSFSPGLPHFPFFLAVFHDTHLTPTRPTLVENALIWLAGASPPVRFRLFSLYIVTLFLFSRLTRFPAFLFQFLFLQVSFRGHSCQYGDLSWPWVSFPLFLPSW